MDWWENVDRKYQTRAYDKVNTVQNKQMLEKVRTTIYQYCGDWNKIFNITNKQGEIMMIDTCLLVY